MGNSNSSLKKPRRKKATVFLSKTGEIYRIPALIFNHEEKILFAFAEKRTSKYDSCAVALVMKKGILTKGDLKVEWSDSKDVVTKMDLKGDCPMNPCPIYSKGKLYLFFIGVEGTIPKSGQICWGINKARLYYITTDDSGQTWSTPTDLTDTLPETKNWATFAVGPGHGIETGSGKLIVPAYAYPSCSSCCKCCRNCLATCFCWCGSTCCCPPPHSLIIYRDPNEEGFKCGDKLEETSLEFQIAEISNNPSKRLYLNARSQGGLRVEAFLDDCGNSFSKSTSKLVETGKGCQGSVVSFPAQPEGAGSSQRTKWLLYSHPISKSQRVDLGVYLHQSPLDENGAWSKPWVINDGPSGYSDLAYMGRGWFACLMECRRGCCTEQIACLLFTYDELQEAIKE